MIRFVLCSLVASAAWSRPMKSQTFEEAAVAATCSTGLECVAPSSGAATTKRGGPLRRRSALCPDNSFSYFDTCPCFPGYTGATCEEKLAATQANPWFTASCPNLKQTVTYSVDTPLSELGGEFSSAKSCQPMKKQQACAYLCYSHPSYGAAVVPTSLWSTAQSAEAALWKSLGGTGSPSHDRAPEHWRGFNNLACLPSSSLGRVIEVGAGPWTQLKGFLHVRSGLSVSEFTVFEPGADGYMRNVASCSYRSGSSLEVWGGGGGVHPFPVVVNSKGGEVLKRGSHDRPYDTLISINVLEHVQDAFAYLEGLYRALRRGGVLIFHERFYEGDDVSGGDAYHPVRVRRSVLDVFLAGFTILFNNCAAGYDGRAGERGYYVIAVKN